MPEMNQYYAVRETWRHPDGTIHVFLNPTLYDTRDQARNAAKRPANDQPGFATFKREILPLLLQPAGLVEVFVTKVEMRPMTYFERDPGGHEREAEGVPQSVVDEAATRG